MHKHRIGDGSRSMHGIKDSPDTFMSFLHASLLVLESIIHDIASSRMLEGKVKNPGRVMPGFPRQRPTDKVQRVTYSFRKNQVIMIIFGNLYMPRPPFSFSLTFHKGEMMVEIQRARSENHQIPKADQ